MSRGVIPELESITYIPARDQWCCSNVVKDWIVLHSIEAGEFDWTAENCARYFQDPGGRVASTQWVVDINSTIRCAEFNMRVAGAVGANERGWHIEQAGFAGQTFRDWRDEYSAEMILSQTAPLVAALCIRDGIPIRFVDAAGLKRGVRGITTHHECWKAFGGDVRTDPGAEYPMFDLLLPEVEALVHGTKPPTPPTKPPILEDLDMPRASYELTEKHGGHVPGETWVEMPNGDLKYHGAPSLLAKQRMGDSGHPAATTAIVRAPVAVTAGELEYAIRMHNGNEAADAWKNS